MNDFSQSILEMALEIIFVWSERCVANKFKNFFEIEIIYYKITNKIK